MQNEQLNSVNTLAKRHFAASQPDRTPLPTSRHASMKHASTWRKHVVHEIRLLREMDVAEQEFRTSQQRLQQIQRDQRSTENYMRLFGTREEMAAQGEDYVSPIGDMFQPCVRALP